MSDQQNLAVVPAYGIDYIDSSVMMKAWEAGKDFKIIGGPYISIRDTETLKDQGYTGVVFVFGNMKFCITVSL